METYKTYEGQSFFDIAMAVYGDTEMAFDIAAKNGISVIDNPPAEITLPVPANFPKKEVRSRTGHVIIHEGIEFWAIEYDFKVN